MRALGVRPVEHPLHRSVEGGEDPRPSFGIELGVEVMHAVAVDPAAHVGRLPLPGQVLTGVCPAQRAGLSAQRALELLDRGPLCLPGQPRARRQQLGAHLGLHAGDHPRDRIGMPDADTPCFERVGQLGQGIEHADPFDCRPGTTLRPGSVLTLEQPAVDRATAGLEDLGPARARNVHPVEPTPHPDQRGTDLPQPGLVERGHFGGPERSQREVEVGGLQRHEFSLSNMCS